MPERERPVVCNTTPIIALSLVEQLALLALLYEEVLVPPAVAEEVLAGGRGHIGLDAFQKANWIHVTPLTDPMRATLLSDLDRGEAEVIALALETGATLLILDDQLARRHATRLGLQVTGTLGILLRGKREGLISEIRPLLETLIAGGIYLSESLIAQVLVMAGEV